MCASSKSSGEIAQACMGLIALICDKSNNLMNWPICRKQSSIIIINDPIREGLFSRNFAPMRVRSEGSGEIAPLLLSYAIRAIIS